MTAGAPTENRPRRSSTEILSIYGLAILLTLAGFVIAYQFVEPAPPDRIAIATGGEQGAYFMFGQRYRDILARDGVTLDIRSTSGSIENIGRLTAEREGVDVAFVQGGTGDANATPDLVALGSLYFEPLWVFTRVDIPAIRLTQLRDRPISIGGEGSGTRAVAMQLLADTGMTDDSTVLHSIGGAEAETALLQRQVDAAFFVGSSRSPLIRRMLMNDQLRLTNFERAEAYTRRHRFLSRVTLPEGVIDLKGNTPDHDVVLLAPAATLVARADLHPALIGLLLRAATEVHREGGLFEAPGVFPSDKFLDFPLSGEARRYFERGPSFLDRYLPFWAANMIDRLKILLLPLITLLIPFFKIVPPTYKWRVRSKIIRLYKDLRAVDDAFLHASDGQDFTRVMADLDRIEEEVKTLSVPASYADALYGLRLHIDLVRDKARQARAE